MMRTRTSLSEGNKEKAGETLLWNILNAGEETNMLIF